eukprot:TRINITY_DN16569_c0_g1_i1.p1 TRINITY_DN16569_c0_g1~~TRINITY_DN16569_c0_g1_i1.p1  ORF type:complete len:190 (+),score=46.32 TRINITY_DN16569_c0_g1_i1:56-625(+)
MDSWDEDGQQCQLSVADLSKISKMSGKQWREERKRRIKERIFGKVPKLEEAVTSLPEDEADKEKNRVFYQEGGNMFTLGMTGDKLKEKIAKENKNLKNQGKLHEKLKSYMQKEQTERPANMSAILLELEEIVQKGGSLSKERANEMISELRSRLPKDHLMWSAPSSSARNAMPSTKAGRLMMAMNKSKK